MPYIPHTKEDVDEMLRVINAESIDELFDEIPKNLRCGDFKNIPEGMNEMTLLQEAEKHASSITNGACFIGAGAYEHHIPAAVWDITSRGEFLTAYTPYQAEASQGTLQLLYEFQTMIAELTAMEVANASLYDGASALAEAILMAVRLNRKKQNHRILLADTLHPYYKETVETIVSNQQIEMIQLPFDKKSGTLDIHELAKFEHEALSALVIPQPNFFGCLEQVDVLTNWAHQQNIHVIGVVNPIALGLIKPPGEWGEKGADIVCGEGQSLGVPLASGGPYFGFFSTKKEYVRQVPGRIVGKTVDAEGKTGYTLTLQAREQHIRRGKATSNICTNQGLLTTAATIHMSLLGPEGLEAVAQNCHAKTKQLIHALTNIKGVEPVFNSPFFHECLLKLDKPVEGVLESLSAYGIAGGYPIAAHFPALANTMLICATEMRTQEEIMQYKDALSTIMKD